MHGFAPSRSPPRGSRPRFNTAPSERSAVSPAATLGSGRSAAGRSAQPPQGASPDAPASPDFDGRSAVEDAGGGQARVRTLAISAARPAERTADIYADGRLEIDFGRRAVTYGQREVALTPLEFKLLSAFVRHPRQVLSRDQLLDLVWGDAYGVSGDQVKLYVGYLRRKLEPATPESAPIETVRGFGYRYVPGGAG